MTIYTTRIGSWSGERIEPEYITNMPPDTADATIDGKQLVPCDTITLPIISGEDVVSVSQLSCSKAAPVPAPSSMVYVLGVDGVIDGIYYSRPIVLEDDYDPGIEVVPQRVPYSPPSMIVDNQTYKGV
jgi:hypothetical protein